MSMHKIPLTPIEESGLRAHGLDIGKPSQLSDAFRQGVRYASAQLPSQGGEAVAEYQQLSRYNNWDRIDKAAFDLGKLGSCPERFRALYTHPADQVADDLTMVKVSRELLERLEHVTRTLAPHLRCHADLRALLGVKP